MESEKTFFSFQKFISLHFAIGSELKALSSFARMWMLGLLPIALNS
jgi:hypothetical protein